jgi:hypothetical protein
MSENTSDYGEYVAQTANLLDLSIAPEYFTNVVNNFATIAQIATLVLEFPLSEQEKRLWLVIESASVFEP